MKFLIVLMLALGSLAQAQIVSSAGDVYSGGDILSTTPVGASNSVDPAVINWDTSVGATATPGDNICVGTLFNVSALSGGCANIYTLAQLQTALNNAVCGQKIILQNAAIPGAYTLPAGLVCAPGNWVIVEHDITDPIFPVEHTRIDPCYHGIPQSVMPYYPYPGIDANPNNCGRHMPMLKVAASSANPALSPKTPTVGAGTPSVGFIRFIGIEITRDQTQDIVTALVSMGYQPANAGQDCQVNNLAGSPPAPTITSLPLNATACMNDQPIFIIFDRCIVHGDAQRQTTRAFSLGGMRWVAVIDSYIYDISLTLAGGGGDAQAYFWGAGHGYTNVGFGKFNNNFVSASTMANLFCGSFAEALSPATGFDGIPHDCHYFYEWYYKNPLWNVERGQTFNETLTIEGVSYPPAPDQELTVQPTAIEVQTGQSYQFITTWLNDNFGGINRMFLNGTDCTKGNTVCVDGVLRGNSTLGLIVTNGEHQVGTGAWNSQNQVTYQYVTCTGVGLPIAACNGVTSTGTHSIVFHAATTDNRSGHQGSSRILSATSTVTVVAAAPTQQMVVGPKAPDLSIQPSYQDACAKPGDPCNVRRFCVTMFASPNFTTTTMSWKVDGITNGDATHGQMCSMAAGPCVTPGANDQQAAYCSAPAPGPHTVSVASANGTSDSSLITVSNTAPIVGYDLKVNTVKNGFEFKCMNRGLLELSLLENAWGGPGNGGPQGGTVFLGQTINQVNQVTDGSGANVGYGPEHINDVTLSYLKAEHFGKGFGIVGMPLHPAALGLHRLSVSNFAGSDINDQRWGNGFSNIVEALRIFGDACATNTGNCSDAGWTTAANPPLDNVSFNHVTITGHSTNGFGISENLFQKTMLNLSIKNSLIMSQGANTFINANGEAGDCNTATGTGANNTEVRAFQACSIPFAFHHIALLDNTAVISGAGWPDAATLWQPASTAADLFAGFNGFSDDLRPCTGFHIPSATCTAGTYAAGGARQADDGLALGADIAGINAMEAIVRYGAPNPPPTVDLLDLSLMALPTRSTNHFHGSLGGGSDTFSILDTDSLYPVGYPLSTFFWVKHPTGNPWDIEKYNATYAAMHWITEDGDSVDQSTCIAAGFSGGCFLDPRAYKRFINPVPLLPRSFTYGSTVTIDSPGPNTFIRTTNCELPGTNTSVNLGDVSSVTTGPFNMTWGGSIDSGAGGGAIDNVNGVPTIKNSYFYGGPLSTRNFNDKEDTFYPIINGQTQGRVAWFFYQKVSGIYVLRQHTISNILTSGSTPPNFPCGAGQIWWQ